MFLFSSKSIVKAIDSKIEWNGLGHPEAVEPKDLIANRPTDKVDIEVLKKLKELRHER